MLSADCSCRNVPSDAEWTRVGQNAEAVYMGDYVHNGCPYPLQAMLARYHLPEKTLHTALLYYDEDPPPALPEWFAQYNGRQTIEAGIKEGKGVFTLKRHLVRSPIGMQLQEQFALLGANFVRWAAAWVKDMLRQVNRNFATALGQIKTLVRIASHTCARWVRNGVGHTLLFEDGPFAGTIICLSGEVAVQQALPLQIRAYMKHVSPDCATVTLEMAREGTLRIRPLNKPVYVPDPNTAVARVPEEWQESVGS